MELSHIFLAVLPFISIIYLCKHEDPWLETHLMWADNCHKWLQNEEKRPFHSKNMSDFAFKTTQSKSSYYYLRYYSRSSTFCGCLLDFGPSNVRHAMKTFCSTTYTYLVSFIIQLLCMATNQPLEFASALGFFWFI